MRIYCKQCGLKLSAELEILGDLSLLNEKDQEEFIPQGFYCISDGSFFTHSEGAVIVNLCDEANLLIHEDPKRSSGCCGMSGSNGMNRVCRNGHEVATEWSDCWMPHALLFDPSRVELR